MKSVAITGSENDADAIASAAGGADIVLDAIGDITDAGPTMNALRSLKAYGNALLVGGCMSDLSINYKWLLDKQITILGSSWYPRSGNAEMIGMIANGALDISVLRATCFQLDAVNEAVLWAAAGPGGLEHAALVP